MPLNVVIPPARMFVSASARSAAPCWLLLYALPCLPRAGWRPSVGLFCCLDGPAQESWLPNSQFANAFPLWIEQRGEDVEADVISRMTPSGPRRTITPPLCYGVARIPKAPQVSSTTFAFERASMKSRDLIESIGSARRISLVSKSHVK
jgi:hypothetical protein